MMITFDSADGIMTRLATAITITVTDTITTTITNPIWGVGWVEKIKKGK